MPKNRPIMPRDIEVGRRIRLRRAAVRMSQSDLGDKLGVTFQQVQKYEKGSNRISAGRLEHVSQILGVPMTYFYDDVKSSDGIENPLQFFTVPGVVKLGQAYTQIQDQKARAALVQMAEAMARITPRSRK